MDLKYKINTAIDNDEESQYKSLLIEAQLLIADLTSDLQAAEYKLEEMAKCQYSWIDGYPTNSWYEEWFIAKLDNGQRVVLKRLPEEYSYDFKTADDTYYKAYRIKKWMQFPDSEFISLAPKVEPQVQSNADKEIDKPCRIGHMIFREGVKVKTVIEAAQRQYEYNPLKEITADALCFVNAIDDNNFQ